MSNGFVVWLSEFEVLGWLIAGLSRLVPYLLIIAAFAFYLYFYSQHQGQNRTGLVRRAGSRCFMGNSRPHLRFGGG